MSHHQHHSTSSSSEHSNTNKKVQEFLQHNHIDFVEKAPLAPGDLYAPMHPTNFSSHAPSSQEVFESMTAHGSMAKTLLNTEAKHEELSEMTEADTGGQEDS